MTIDVIKALSDAGCRLHYRGFGYLAEAAEAAKPDEKARRRPMTDIYAHIAAKYSVTPFSVYRAIRAAIARAYAAIGADGPRRGKFRVLPTVYGFIRLILRRTEQPTGESR